MIDSVLVANRGEIARRVIRTCRRLGIRSIAVYSEADAESLHVLEADESVAIGAPAAAESYLRGDVIVEQALRAGAAAVHPGYGFLSENGEFASAVEAAGMLWVGPTPSTIEEMGHKINAREIAKRAGVPVTDGSGRVDTPEAAVAAARSIGYPVMVKPAAGGGGIGMAIAADDAELTKAIETAQSRAARAFGNAELLLETYVPGARHVEVQVLGLADGSIVSLGERDCSVQRRHQKLVEETPSPGLPDALRAELLTAAERVAAAVGYRGAGTCEFLVSLETERFYFLEMNTRLQVEHPITELVTGVDLVEQQLRIAAGLAPTLPETRPGGHAIEYRIYAEDPQRFLPSPGTITRWDEPSGEGIRIDSGFRADDKVTLHYDPLLAKLCVHGADRESALARSREALDAFEVEGVKTTIAFHCELLENEAFLAGRHTTQLVASMR
jgi:acetyl-CoA carboxylase biotin carboxylase subunit